MASEPRSLSHNSHRPTSPTTEPFPCVDAPLAVTPHPTMTTAGMELGKSAALKIPAIRRLVEARDALLLDNAVLNAQRDALAAEVAYLKTGLPAQFMHFKASFDADTTIARYRAPDIASDPRYLTNFLGVKVDPKVVPGLLDGRGGEIEPPPIPGNWHACIAEWAAVLRAVDLAHERFSIIELGCGWGCWLNNAGRAAKRRGLAIDLIGIEGDAGHLQFARETCAANGIEPSEVTLIHGLAGPDTSVALFPKQAVAGSSWGLEPIFDPSPEDRARIMQTGQFEELPVLNLADVIGERSQIDLLHIDIQGGEADLVEACLPLLRDRLAYLVIGTHSRPIEGRLMAALSADGWVLEIERPAIITIDRNAVTLVIDGVQGWRNPRLCQLP